MKAPTSEDLRAWAEAAVRNRWDGYEAFAISAGQILALADKLEAAEGMEMALGGLINDALDREGPEATWCGHCRGLNEHDPECLILAAIDALAAWRKRG